MEVVVQNYFFCNYILTYNCFIDVVWEFIHRRNLVDVPKKAFETLRIDEILKSLFSFLENSKIINLSVT